MEVVCFFISGWASKVRHRILFLKADTVDYGFHGDAVYNCCFRSKIPINDRPYMRRDVDSEGVFTLNVFEAV